MTHHHLVICHQNNGRIRRLIIISQAILRRRWCFGNWCLERWLNERWCEYVLLSLFCQNEFSSHFRWLTEGYMRRGESCFEKTEIKEWVAPTATLEVATVAYYSLPSWCIFLPDFSSIIPHDHQHPHRCSLRAGERENERETWCPREI